MTSADLRAIRIQRVSVVIIPHHQLAPETLVALIDEFVTREGAVHGHVDVPLEVMRRQVMDQLRRGTVVIVFDEAEESVSLAPGDLPRGRG